MENAVIDKEAAEQPELKQSNGEWVIRRPKRKTVTEEEARRWTEDFASQRKEQFIAAIRKSRSEPRVSTHGSESLPSNARGATHGAG